MSTSFPGEPRVCRVCSQSYPANSPTCPRCGYTPAASAPDVDGGWKPKIPLPAPPNLSRVGVAVLVTGLVLPVVAGALLFLSFSEDSGGSAGPADRPAPADPGPGGPEGDRCERTMKRYLRDLARAFGDATATGALFVDSSSEFGPGSPRFRALIDIYGDVEVNTLMARGKAKKAVRRAAPGIRAACAR